MTVQNNQIIALTWSFKKIIIWIKSLLWTQEDYFSTSAPMLPRLGTRTTSHTGSGIKPVSRVSHFLSVNNFCVWNFWYNLAVTDFQRVPLLAILKVRGCQVGWTPAIFRLVIHSDDTDLITWLPRPLTHLFSVPSSGLQVFSQPISAHTLPVFPSSHPLLVYWVSVASLPVFM